MSRFNTAVKTGVRSPITTTAPATTALGAPGFTRDAKSELFLLAVSNMASYNTFHEFGSVRDARYTNLIRQVATDTQWLTGFLGFLRDTANMRSASIIAAADAVKARLEQGVTGNRHLISSVLQRADEPGELLAYWVGAYGRNLPAPVKRGIADAVDRLYTERSFLKWDSESKGYRFADVIQLVHPKTAIGWRNDLFKYILDARYKGDAAEIPGHLTVLGARRELMGVPVDFRRQISAGQLAEAGMTWESLAGWLQGPMDAAAWESAIPSMGYMALLRNLRNFDQAGISKTAKREVEDRLTDPEQVARSRQLPMRFLSAYRATRDSGTVTSWGPTIEQALNLSLANVPALPGRTLVLVDLSGSMTYSKLSDRSDLTYKDAASVFGAALATRCESADLVGFDNSLYRFSLTVHSSVLPLASDITQVGGGGTATAQAISTAYAGHDRIVLLTDEQAGTGYWYATSVDQVLKQIGKPSYTWNLAGYRSAHAESGGNNQHTFGGLSDAAFRMIPLIEAGEHQTWPWL